jgi:hypothetical protein
VTLGLEVGHRHHAVQPLVPALVLGAAAGTVIGGVIETFSFPLVGTFFGATEGCLVGSTAGFAVGLVLVVAGSLTPSGWPISSPIRVTRRIDQRPVSAVVQCALAVGAIGGGGLGAIAGLIVGVATYLPTAPFAVVEGGILGAVSGIVIALLVAAGFLALRLQVGR